MNKAKQLILSVMLVLGVGLAVVPVAVHADAKSDACNAISAGADCSSTNGGADIGKIVTLIVNLMSIIVGVVAVIMIIFGGLKFITSNGEANNISAAKNTIVYALVGLVIVAMAQFIVKFVLEKLN